MDIKEEIRYLEKKNKEYRVKRILSYLKDFPNFLKENENIDKIDFTSIDDNLKSLDFLIP